jgi:hypothetical protein
LVERVKVRIAHAAPLLNRSQSDPQALLNSVS